MLRRVGKTFAAVSVVAGVPYLAYRIYSGRDEAFHTVVRTKDANGKPVKRAVEFPLLPLKTVEERINLHAVQRTHTTSDGTIWNSTTAALASNDPIEDANASQIVRRDSVDPSAPGEYLFFAVMDGHRGNDTSKLLSRILIKAVSLQLAKLIESTRTTANSGALNSLKSFFWGSSSGSRQDARVPDPQQVSNTIADAFENLDQELLQAPVVVLASEIAKQSPKDTSIPDLSGHPLALATMLPAVAGSCALMAVFDTAHRDLYVACTGDSRAVAGVWEPSEDNKGYWRIEVLSEDQTGRNPSELERIRSEHPKEERDVVVMGGRILGGLEPSRAFGDAKYKWSRAAQEVLSNAFLAGNNMPMRPPNAYSRTPPYVTARPVVTHSKFSLPASDNKSSSGKGIRFLVLATDGLWDDLSNEEVVALVGGHFSGVRGTIPKVDLPTLAPTSMGCAGVEGKDKEKDRSVKGSWAFKDENVSAHLIRNASGCGDERELRRLLSIPAPYSRSYRDDVTVTVVWWEAGNETTPHVSTEKLEARL